MGLGRVTSINYSYGLAPKLNTRWLVHGWNTFGARISHEQTWTHKIHHGPDLGKPLPSCLQYTLCLSMRFTSKWHFVLGLPNGSLEITKVGIFVTLGPHNFTCRPPIEMRFEAKLQPSLRAFQWYVTHHLNTRKLGRFLTFSGWESNCQFDSQPFFWP